MRIPSLFTRNIKLDRFWFRPARNDDWPTIERLLDSAERYHLALEWWTIQEWVGSPALLLMNAPDGEAVGLMLSAVGDGPIAWLRAICVTSDEYLLPLLEASAEAVLEQGGIGLAFVGDQGWILPKLKRVGFEKVNRVITLRCRGSWRVDQGPLGLELRTVTTSDIDAILGVDRIAFTPMWCYDRNVLRRALDLAHSFDVAYLNGECVGYQLSTLRGGRGHIVRLAVHPNRQRQGIGGRLLSEALRALEEAKAESVTVNTQENNLASIQLYRRFSFERLGKPWSVWFLSLVE